MSAYNIQTPGNYPEENTQHSEHGESLKSQQKIPSAYSSGGLRGVPITGIPRNIRRKLDIVMVQYNIKSDFCPVRQKLIGFCN